LILTQQVNHLLSAHAHSASYPRREELSSGMSYNVKCLVTLLNRRQCYINKLCLSKAWCGWLGWWHMCMYTVSVNTGVGCPWWC